MSLIPGTSLDDDRPIVTESGKLVKITKIVRMDWGGWLLSGYLVEDKTRWPYLWRMDGTYTHLDQTLNLRNL